MVSDVGKNPDRENGERTKNLQALGGVHALERRLKIRAWLEKVISGYSFLPRSGLHGVHCSIFPAYPVAGNLYGVDAKAERRFIRQLLETAAICSEDSDPFEQEIAKLQESPKNRVSSLLILRLDSQKRSCCFSATEPVSIFAIWAGLDPLDARTSSASFRNAHT